MKTLKITTAFAALALLSAPAFAGKENCFEKTVIANYVGGSGTFTTCNSTSANNPSKDHCESIKR